MRLMFCRSRYSENLYGYSAEEALNRYIGWLIMEKWDYASANHLIHRGCLGESWTGLFPVKNKKGENFLVYTTVGPFYDDNGTLIGVIAAARNARDFREVNIAVEEKNHTEPDSNHSGFEFSTTNKLGLDPEKSLQVSELNYGFFFLLTLITMLFLG